MRSFGGEYRVGSYHNGLMCQSVRGRGAAGRRRSKCDIYVHCWQVTALRYGTIMQTTDSDLNSRRWRASDANDMSRQQLLARTELIQGVSVTSPLIPYS